MKQTEVNRSNKLYQRHQKLLKLQGKSEKTIAAYSRAVRRIRDYFDCCPDKLTLEQLENYFAELMPKALLKQFKRQQLIWIEAVPKKP